MAGDTHTHETGETPAHDPGAGHTAPGEVATAAHGATTAAVVGPGPGGVVARLGLTAIGAAAMIVGAFLDWIEGIRGTDLSFRIFFQPLSDWNPSFVTSAGFVAIAIALLALIGLASGTGWLTRLAGALGIAAFVLFAISVYRTETTSTFIESIQIGPWLVLGGAAVALIGVFVGSRRMVVLP
jgi:hypothetical protein